MQAPAAVVLVEDEGLLAGGQGDAVGDRGPVLQPPVAGTASAPVSALPVESVRWKASVTPLVEATRKSTV